MSRLRADIILPLDSKRICLSTAERNPTAVFQASQTLIRKPGSTRLRRIDGRNALPAKYILLARCSPQRATDSHVLKLWERLEAGEREPIKTKFIVKRSFTGKRKPAETFAIGLRPSSFLYYSYCKKTKQN